MQSLRTILTILKHPSLLGWARALHLPSLTGGARGWVFLPSLFIIHYSLFIAIGVAIASCTSSDDSSAPVNEAVVETERGYIEGPMVGFAAQVAEADPSVRGVTRAEPEPGDGEFALTNEQLQELGFGVYCWYTGSTDVVFTGGTTPTTHISNYLGATGFMLMRNQKVEYDDETGLWGYAPKKYWPQDPNEKLTLRAYAPYTNYLVTDDKGMPLLPVVVSKYDYHNGTQHDPLWGTSRHGGTDGEETTYGTLYNNYTYVNSGDNLTADSRDGFIDWYFHHGMSKLMFTCSIVANPGCETVTITKVTISPLYDQGLLSLCSPTASSGDEDKPIWTERSGNMEVELNEGDPNTTAGDLAPMPTPEPEPPGFKPYPFKITVDTDPSKATGPFNLLSKGLLIIPRNFTSEDLTVALTYTIDGVDSDPQTAVGTISSKIFYGNTAYTLGLVLTPSIKGLDITLVQSAYTTWSEGGTGTHVVYNW